MNDLSIIKRFTEKNPNNIERFGNKLNDALLYWRVILYIMKIHEILTTYESEKSTMPILLKGNETLAYRDPTCIFVDGTYHLFFTVSKKENGYMYNFVGHSASKDLKTFSEVTILTEKDPRKNFCSPGNVLRVGEYYRIFICSYPMPKPWTEMSYADESARLFFIETTDFVTFSSPKKIYAKGLDCADEGRMIDPFVLEDQNQKGRYLLFFKQNGVSVSESYDLHNWRYLGSADGGENACVLVEDGTYLLLHSPHNGIGLKKSDDLSVWQDCGTVLPKESNEEWANGRLTAAFAMKNEDPTIPYRYIVFFHGSKKDAHPETHGAASLAMYYTNDFKTYIF